MPTPAEIIAAAVEAPVASPVVSAVTIGPSDVAPVAAPQPVGLEAALAAAASGFPVVAPALAAVQHPTAPAVEAVAKAVTAVEPGWSTSEGQLSAAFLAVCSALTAAIVSGQITLPAAVEGWTIAGLAVAVAVERSAYTIARTWRKK